VCCSVLQCVAVCSSVAVCCSVLQCVAVCCSVLQNVAVCLSVLQCADIREIATRVLRCVAVCCSVLQCVAVCCSVLQFVAVCCSVLQCVAAVSPISNGLLVHIPQHQLKFDTARQMCCSVSQRVAVCCSVLQSCHLSATAFLSTYPSIKRYSIKSDESNILRSIANCNTYRTCSHMFTFK